MLKEIFSPSDCAVCRLCCNFHPSSVWESPFIPETQARRLEREGIPMERRETGGWSFRFHFEADEAVNCPKLDPAHGCTFPNNDEKPFECQIWPLRLMGEGGRLLLGRYRDCPALTGDRAERLDRFARGALLETLLAFVAKNPESVRRRSPEYEIIWEGDFPSAADRMDNR